MKVLGVISIIFFLFIHNILADSDGYFCSCKNVLAYELKWTTENINPENEHLLRIIRFDSINGLTLPALKEQGF